eukprot:UN34512
MTLYVFDLYLSDPIYISVFEEVLMNLMKLSSLPENLWNLFLFCNLALEMKICFYDLYLSDLIFFLSRIANVVPNPFYSRLYCC